jgi:hypothetical protein
MNQLFYGDNLPILRAHIPDASVDLVYLDPPFNSQRNYNLLLEQHKGAPSRAQIVAFEDTWQSAVALVGARWSVRKGADTGIDGRIGLWDLRDKYRECVVQVKGGALTLSAVRDFAHVIQRENAVLGLLLTMREPTREMYSALRSGTRSAGTRACRSCRSPTCWSTACGRRCRTPSA